MHAGIERYMFVRSELVRLYKYLTTHTFEVKAPRSVFLTTQQLEYIESNPPIWGKEYYTKSVYKLVTAIHLMNAFEIMDGELELGFAKPRETIPPLYDNIQDYIRYWLEIKLNSTTYKTPSIAELRAFENVAKGIFFVYAHFKREKINDNFKNGFGNSSFYLANLQMARIINGDIDKAQDISFISYIDKYLEQEKTFNRSVNNYYKETHSIIGNKDPDTILPPPLMFPKLHIGLS